MFIIQNIWQWILCCALHNDKCIERSVQRLRTTDFMLQKIHRCLFKGLVVVTGAYSLISSQGGRWHWSRSEKNCKMQHSYSFVLEGYCLTRILFIPVPTLESKWMRIGSFNSNKEPLRMVMGIMDWSCQIF